MDVCFFSFEIIILKLIKIQYNIKNLCLAGGVALNCVANGKILKKFLKMFGFNLKWVIVMLHFFALWFDKYPQVEKQKSRYHEAPTCKFLMNR